MMPIPCDAVDVLERNPKKFLPQQVPLPPLQFRLGDVVRGHLSHRLW
jgi:hypothetical protein